MVEEVKGAGRHHNINTGSITDSQQGNINDQFYSPVYCNRLIDTTTEILLCATIFTLIFMLFIW